jgi:general secretion pathway protein H
MTLKTRKHFYNSNHREAGYTLVEILVVILIISIVTSVGLLSIRHNDNKRLESYANELIQRLTFAEEQAMLQPVIIGFVMNEKHFQFVRLQSSANHDSWEPMVDRILGEQAIPDDMAWRLEVKQSDSQLTDKQESAHPQVVISTNGDITPFTLYIGMKGQKPRYAVIGQADGSVTQTLLN